MKETYMMNGQSMIDLIKQRTSIRTYANTPIEPEKRAAMKAFLKENTDNPFGAQVRFALIDKADAPHRLGTYGLLRGMKTFIVGCAVPGAMDMEGFGYAFEKAVLFAGSLGLGTCWAGGTFTRGAFANAVGLKDEILPAISPLGYASKRPSVIERMTAAGAGARTRKAFGEMFFDGDFDTPLQLPDGALKTCLEMVRIGPSASNKQPWRVVKQGGKLHFYLQKTKNYAGNGAFGFCMQCIDMGIAACHFELSARALGLIGKIMIDDPGLLTQSQGDSGLSYKYSWG